MAHKRLKPDLDERFTLPPDTDPDDVLRALLGVKPTADDESEDEPPKR